jgi:hypothetical protein
MALLVRIYFNGVFGALGGLLGWMLFGVFGDKSRSDLGQWALGGMLIGGCIGYFVVSVEAIRDLSLARFCRLASYGVALGALGGAAGMCIGEWVNMGVIKLIGAAKEGGSAGQLVGVVLGRGLGWMFLGVAIGVSEGIAARSLGKLSYGTLGGAIGGFVGGALFGLFYYLLVIRGEASEHGALSYFWAALGLVILGASIGSLSAFVQGVLQPASVKVMRGWQEGREYPLLKADTLLGREEHADIALFRDMRVEKRHAVIKRQGNRFLLINNHAPPQQTRVNDEQVPQARELRDGDRIQLGNIILRFQMREAQNRRRAVRSG